MVTKVREQMYAQLNGNINRRVWSGVIFNPKAYGCVGDGVTDDAGAFQSFLIDVFKTEHAVIDLAGGTYLLSKTLDIPPGRYVKFQNGVFKASLDFVGDYLLKTGGLGSIPGGFNAENLSFDNVTFDCSQVCGGLNLHYTLRIYLTECSFIRFSTIGLRAAAFGHETIVDRCQFLQYPWGDDLGTYTGTGLELNQNDNHVINCIFARCLHGIVNNGQYNMFNLNHIYTSENGIGFKNTANAAFASICQMYVDTTHVVIENPWHTEIMNCKFLTVTTDSSFAFIVLKPLASGTYIAGLKIEGCSFQNGQAGTTVKSIDVDTSSGTFDPANIRQCSVLSNSFNNAQEKASRRRRSTYGGGTSFEIDFSSYIPFGAIRNVLYSIVPDSAGVFPKSQAKITDNTVTVTTDVSLNAVVTIEYDINVT